VRAYLQVACAGLGFDIGEVWWTQNENGSSTVAALGEFVGRESSRVGVRLDRWRTPSAALVGWNGVLYVVS
jgi:hypothetical protein